MKTRVNLTIEESLVKQIKAYAAKKHVSVSDIVEEHFSKIVKPVQTSIIFDLIDSLDKPQIDESADLKKLYHEEKAKQHGL